MQKRTHLIETKNNRLLMAVGANQWLLQIFVFIHLKRIMFRYRNINNIVQEQFI